MIQGAVNAAYEAVVDLSVQGPDGQPQNIEAVVDTGYTGFLTLPTTLVTELGLPFAYIGWAFLANDDEVSFDVHDTLSPRLVTLSARRVCPLGSAPLVGMLLLDRHSLNIEVESGGRVVIQARA